MENIKTLMFIVFFLTALVSVKAENQQLVNPLKKGKELAKHCAWCHDVKRNLIAPSFMVILDKYKNVPDKELKEIFFNSIKNGSKGKWNKWIEENIQTKLGKPENMYMPAQKPYFNDEEIKLIVDWLLSLRKKENVSKN